MAGHRLVISSLADFLKTKVFYIFLSANDEITLISKEADRMRTMIISSLARSENQA